METVHTGCLHQQGLLTSSPPPTCCRHDPLWRVLPTAGWGSDPQTLLEYAAQHGAVTITLHSSQFSRREPESHGQEAGASPPFLSLLPPTAARLRASPQALLSSRQTQAPKYHRLWVRTRARARAHTHTHKLARTHSILLEDTGGRPRRHELFSPPHARLPTGARQPRSRSLRDPPHALTHAHTRARTGVPLWRAL